MEAKTVSPRVRTRGIIAVLVLLPMSALVGFPPAPILAADPGGIPGRIAPQPRAALTMSGAGLVPCAASADRPASQSILPSTIFRANESGPPRVEMNQPGTPGGTACRYIVRTVNRTAARNAERTLTPGARVHLFGPALHGFSAQLTTRQAATLRGNPAVLSVVLDQVATVADTEPSPPWGLDRVDQRYLPLSGTYVHDPTGGSGVKAYVIDTGIRATHQDFGGRVAPGASFVEGSPGTDDCYGHGTHVAGTIGGSTFGVAKAVTLVPVRVLDCGGSGYYSWIIAGIDWMIADHIAGHPAVANLSLGGPVDAGLNQAIAAAAADGIVVVAAAGNSNADACGFSPASAPEALTVGATDTRDARAAFSNTGSCLDLFGPGVDIPSAGIASDTATRTMSGTSMATPHVAGIAAVLYGRYVAVDPATIEAALVGDATPDVVTGGGTASPNLLAHLAPQVPGPQQVFVHLPALYLAEPAIALEGVSTSGASVAFESRTPLVCSVAGATLTPLLKGTCTIKATVLGGGGWDPATTNVSTLVYALRQSIDIPALWAEFEWSGADTPGATASSHLVVSYTSTSTACDVEGTLIRGSEIGDCQLVASQAGNSTYGPAPLRHFVRSVVPASQTLSAPGTAAVTVGDSVDYAGTSSAGLSVDVHSASLSICAAASGLLTGRAPGDCQLRLTQSGSGGVRPSGSSSLVAVSDTSPLMTSVASRDDGRAVIAYTVANEVHLLLCNDLACTNPRDLLIAGDSLFVQDLAVVVASDRPVIAYVATYQRPKPGQDYVDWDFVLRVVSCGDSDCSRLSDTLIDDPDPLVDISVSTVAATVGSNGLPLIAYGGDNFGVRLLACTDIGCSTGTRRAIASSYPDDYGLNPAVTVDQEGLPVVGYLRGVQNPTVGNLEAWTTPVIARCLDATCASTQKTVMGEALRWYAPTLVVPADDRPVMFWTENVSPHDNYGVLNYRVMRGRCDDAACASATTGVVDDSGMVQVGGSVSPWSAAGFNLSSTLGPDGFPRVSYVAITRYARQAGSVGFVWAAVVAACSDAACTTTRRGYVDEWSRVGGWVNRAVHVPMVTRPDGSIIVAFGSVPGAYTSADPGLIGVKLATCAGAVCGTEATAVVSVDTTAPQARLAGPSSPTRTATIAYSLEFSEPVSGLTASDFSRGGTATGCVVGTPSGSGASYAISLSGCSEGTLSLSLKAGSVADAAANSGPAAAAVAATVRIDRTAPTSSAPTAALRNRVALSGASIPVTVSWTGTDTHGSGVARYELARRANGGSTWTKLSSSLALPFVNLTVPASGAFQFRVRAVDKSGNVGAWATGPNLTSRLIQETSASVRYRGTWRKTSSISLSGGSAKYAKTAGASATFSFTGRSIALVTTTAPTRGKVKVYVYGALVATIDLWSTSIRHRVLAWQKTWATSATRTVRLVIVGTHARPRVDLDAFATLK
jgi:hypothetical protein